MGRGAGVAPKRPHQSDRIEATASKRRTEPTGPNSAYRPSRAEPTGPHSVGRTDRTKPNRAAQRGPNQPHQTEPRRKAWAEPTAPYRPQQAVRAQLP
ncbi:hypothetical protein Shyhy02_10900 [Streptomyces hygroscopicus subsp. hygroscopicus]|nr:hypothetical protein Shyhy02_10900 [Streptomyces hygroscopicus subsp. hygroscopicus]